MRGLLAPTKTEGSIFVDFRERRKTHFPLSLSLSLLLPHAHSLSVSSFYFLLTFLFLFILFFPFFFYFFIWIHGSHCAMCPSLIRVHFCPEIIYFFSIQFILNELSSSHFSTSDIFVKISSLESLATYHPENLKNIPTISKFNETFLGHWISRDESNGPVRFVIQDLENFLGFPKPLWQLLLLLLFCHFFLK